MTFDAAAAQALFTAVESKIAALGVCDRVNTHEPENTPGKGISCTITLGSPALEPDGPGSGLAAVSGKVIFAVRLWSAMMQRPLDGIDPNLLAATSAVCNALAGSFTLGGTVRNVDVMGMRAGSGYVQHEGKEMRVIDITLPIEINDLWGEVA